MKRVLLLVCITVFTALNVTAQDFVSKFMSENQADTALHCISISPRMMEEILKSNTCKEEDKEIMNFLANLKSMQVVSAEHSGSNYFRKAEEILEKNTNRFEPIVSFNGDNECCYILTRKRDEVIIELVMLCYKASFFQLISITGCMDETFLPNLTKIMFARKGNKN